MIFYERDVYIQKKDGCHLDNQSLKPYKSNTMKNTLQRYGFYTKQQLCALTMCIFLTSVNYSTYRTSPFRYSPSG